MGLALLVLLWAQEPESKGTSLPQTPLYTHDWRSPRHLAVLTLSDFIN